ncbi:MAG: mechanosensitive ion channel [Pirellulaceae bacterium]|nr:mechanosensitive ion channel [Pirellulaceae bacterium]
MKLRDISIAVVFLLLTGAVTGAVSGATSPRYLQDSSEENADASAVQAEATENEAEAANPATEPPVPEPSDAERIAELTEAIEGDKEQLAALTAEFDNPESEYAMAEREFRALNEHRDQLIEGLEKAKADTNTSTETLEKLTSDLETQTTLWRLAKDRFDLAIEDRKTLKEQMFTLRHKLEQDQAALELLTEGPKPKEDEDHPTEGDAKPTDDADDEKSKNSSSEEREERSDSSEKDSDDPDHETDGEEEVDEELLKAQEESALKQAEVKEAEEETESIEARLRDLQQLIAQEQKELNIARKKVDLASAAQHDLGLELAKVQSENADPVEINTLRNAIAKANQRFIQARAEVTEINERLNDHRAELNSLQAEHIIALHEEQKKREEALQSGQLVADLKNPFTLRNILQWLMEHGPRLVFITVGMFVLNRAATLLASRSVRLVTTGSLRGTKAERENRAKTLVGVFQNAATVALFITGSLMILEELGANITVLMGGVAVIGLAVAFGAQNLIKDYFYGFVMLLENQYMLNDTIRIGGVTGQVERITLRMTVLRDSSGIVHFIPNGTINSVTNETHGWSRAVCEIGVSHQVDLDHVIQIINNVSAELMTDEVLGPLLLEKPSEPAIENLGGPNINLKVSVKTVPNKHGSVKQEWLRRIKQSLTLHRVAPPFGSMYPDLRRWDDSKAA